MVDRSQWFVATEWLAQHAGDPRIAVVDGSWHLPDSGRDAGREFLEAHIPGAVFFDIDAIADASTDLPHMLPKADEFAAAVGALGIDDDQKIVVYESSGVFSAPRVWWTFKAMGAKDVVLLEGGLAKWQAEARTVEAGAAAPVPRNFNARFKSDAVSNLREVREGLADGAIQLVDARSRGRFRGEAPETRPGIRSGHMPGSFNLPYAEIVDGGVLGDPASIRRAFDDVGIDLGQPIVTSCGSGVTAAILTLALETIGVEETSLYDGSWTEWGGRDDTEVVTG